MKEIFPDLVMEDEDGYMSIDYIGLIPLLVDAVKNLSAQIEDLSGKNPFEPIRKSATASANEIESTVTSLSQNRPNPFSQTTVIDCNIAENVTSAAILIYDLQGKQIMKLDITERGKTSVSIDGSRLSAGMYIYALIADGQEVATKRMILTD